MELLGKEERRRYRSQLEADGIDFDRLLTDNNEEVDKFNALQWRKYEANLNGQPQIATQTNESTQTDERTNFLWSL